MEDKTSLETGWTVNGALSRRSFLKSTALTGTALATGAVLKPELVALSEALESTREGEGTWKAGTCQGCTSWCSKQVYVHGDRAVKIRGNPHSKVCVGAACVRSHLALQQVYDPDRLKVPMKRTNPEKGAGRTPVSFPSPGTRP